MKKRIAPKKEPKKKARRRSVFRLLRWGALPPAALIAALGVTCLALPGTSLPALSVTVGVILAALGALFIAGAFLGTHMGFLRLIAGVALVAFSVWLFIRADEALTVLVYFLIGALFLRGLMGLTSALFSPKRESTRHVRFVGAVAVLVASFVLFFIPFSAHRYRLIAIGVIAVADAVLELCAFFAGLFRKSAATISSEEGEEKDGKGGKKRAAPLSDEETAAPQKRRGKRGAEKSGAPAGEPEGDGQPEGEEQPEDAQKEEKRQGPFARLFKREKEKKPSGNDPADGN